MPGPSYGGIAEDFIIPARHGRAFHVKKGQVLRIHVVEDQQVGDCVFINAHDHKEQFHVGQSWAINGIMGTGSGRSFKYFYSKPPRENVMLTVLEDTVKNHWGNMGGRCSRRLYELREGLPKDHDHRSCQENLEEALAPHGITGDDIIDIFNVFMNVWMDEDGNFKMREPTCKAGDFIDLRAEMDILAAVSACPSDNNATNARRCKPLGITILDGG